VYALNASDGRVLWRAPVGDSLLGVPVVADGAVYMVVGEGTDASLYALRARDGHLLWRDALARVVGTSLGFTPAVADGVVYLGMQHLTSTNNSNAEEEDVLEAFRTSDGQLVWRTSTDGWVSNSPAVVDGVVYATTAQQMVYAFGAQDGRLRWHFAMEHLPPGTPAAGHTPAVVGGVVYVGAFGGEVFALDARNGTRRWLALPRGGAAGESEAVVQTLVVRSEVVFVGTQPFPHPGFDQSYDGVVYALRAGDGTRLWTYHDQEAPPFSPLLLGP
jgi:outer membrane protein assembly factor BamB